MVDFGREGDGGWFEGVVGGEGEEKVEDSSLRDEMWLGKAMRGG